MPDNEAGQAQQFYNAFRKWASKKYGGWRVFSEIRFTRNEFRKSPEYQTWVAQGAPGWGTVVEQQTQADIERQKRLGGQAEQVGGISIDQLKPGDRERLLALGWTEQSTTSPFGVTTKAMMPPTKPETKEANLISYVPGRVSFNPSTGKFIDLTTGLELTPAQANNLSAQYDASFQTGGWRPGELELQQQQFEWQKQQDQQQLATQQQQAYWQLAQSYSQWRQQLLSELTGPGDWITRWMVKQTPETFPWSPPPSQEEQARMMSSVPEIPEGAPGWGQPAFPSQRPPSIGEIVGSSVGGRTPPAPAWLPELVPSLIAGKPITRQSVPTPSGQQLTRMGESQALALGGYADWAGGRPWRDILGHAQSMLPNTPRGVGSTRWSPGRQGAA